MGFWTLGPVIASLIVSEVASNTLGSLHPWEDQYHIAGITGLVMFVIAFFTLRGALSSTEGPSSLLPS